MKDIIINFINDNEALFIACIISLFVLFIIKLPDIMVSLYGVDENERKRK